MEGLITAYSYNKIQYSRKTDELQLHACMKMTETNKKKSQIKPSHRKLYSVGFHLYKG